MNIKNYFKVFAAVITIAAVFSTLIGIAPANAATVDYSDQINEVENGEQQNFIELLVRVKDLRGAINSNSIENTKIQLQTDNLVALMGSKAVKNDVNDLLARGADKTFIAPAKNSILRAESLANNLPNEGGEVTRQQISTELHNVIANMIDLLRSVPTPENNQVEITPSSNNPDAAYIEINESGSSDDYMIFAFDLENESDSDVDLAYLEIDINTDGTNPRNVVNRVSILINDSEYSPKKATQLNADTVRVRFETAEVLPANTEVEVELVTIFEPQLNNYTRGQEIYAEIDSSGVGVSDIEIEGSAESEIHILITDGPIMTDYEFGATVNPGDNTPDQAVFSVEVGLTAVGDDVYVFGLFERVKDLYGNYFEPEIMSFYSTAERVDQGYLIEEGHTEHFVVVFTYTPEESGFYSGLVQSVKYRVGDYNSESRAYEIDGVKTDNVYLEA